MAELEDQEYLKGIQYRTPANLNARIELHRRFGDNPYGWYNWVRDRLELKPGMHVLEVGCGPGNLWREILQDVPEERNITIGDLSPGMVSDAQNGISGTGGFHFAVYDAQKLPFRSDTFDLVIANHMLYHVPDIIAALSEFRRVLKLGGSLVAATNGNKHMRELKDLGNEISGMAEAVMAFHASQVGRFSLENSPDMLAPYFPDATVQEYPESLHVTEAQPLANYLLSILGQMDSNAVVLGEDFTAKVLEYLRGKLQAGGGVITITKSQGVIIGHKQADLAV